MFEKSINTRIKILSNSILKEINETTVPEELGISNGNEIINEFIEKNEIGLAFEHLIYAIKSVDFKAKTEQIEEIENIGIQLKVDIPKLN